MTDFRNLEGIETKHWIPLITASFNVGCGQYSPSLSSSSVMLNCDYASIDVVTSHQDLR